MQGIILGSATGVMKGDTRSLDYSSYNPYIYIYIYKYTHTYIYIYIYIYIYDCSIVGIF